MVRISHWDLRSLKLIGEARELELVYTLEGRQTRSLSIFDSYHGSEPVLVSPLGYDVPYNDLQDRVRHIAQDFFNTFPGPEIVMVTE